MAIKWRNSCIMSMSNFPGFLPSYATLTRSKLLPCHLKLFPHHLAPSNCFHSLPLFCVPPEIQKAAHRESSRSAWVPTASFWIELMLYYTFRKAVRITLSRTETGTHLISLVYVFHCIPARFFQGPTALDPNLLVNPHLFGQLLLLAA